MADFFAGAYGAKFPDVVMNSGPLPPAGGLPAPLHDTADAKINYNSTLLGNLDPYAYGEPGYQSSQTSYVNHPHRIQKLVPMLRLPVGRVNSPDTFEISHGVDDSDIAFVMRLDRNSKQCPLVNADRSAFRERMGMSVDPFVNLCTLNYLLAGFQLCLTQNRGGAWWDLLHVLDIDRFKDSSKLPCFSDIRHIVRHLITPFGIVRGSEKQGGQDETGFSAATWPVNFVTNMVLDGKEGNVVNLWSHLNIDAGDDLVLRLKPMPIPRKPNAYTLNHYYKQIVRQDFESPLEQVGMRMTATHVWQLVPDIFNLDGVPENCSHFGGQKYRDIRLPPGMHVPRDYIWQSFGFWHIGRSQVRFRSYSSSPFYNNDMATPMKLHHMDMTFQPSWHKCPGEPMDGDGAAPVRAAGGVAVVQPVPGHYDGIHPGLFDLFRKQDWTPSLHLERSAAGGGGQSGGVDVFGKRFMSPVAMQGLSDATPASAAPAVGSSTTADPFDRFNSDDASVDVPTRRKTALTGVGGAGVEDLGHDDSMLDSAAGSVAMHVEESTMSIDVAAAAPVLKAPLVAPSAKKSKSGVGSKKASIADAVSESASW